jgi:hypothetical protein
MNVKEREEKKRSVKKILKGIPHKFKAAAAALLLLLNPRDSFVMIKSLIWVPPSSSPSFHAYI